MWSALRIVGCLAALLASTAYMAVAFLLVPVMTTKSVLQTLINVPGWGDHPLLSITELRPISPDLWV